MMTDSYDSTDFYNTIARYYDAENEFMTDDLELYDALAEKVGDPVLDIGCGTGRVTLSLASGGYRVVGLDRSREMLRRGERKLKGRPDLRDLVRFVEADALTYDPGEIFKLVLLPYNALMHFTELATQRALIRHLASFLAEDGLMVFDLPNAGESFSTVDDDAVTLERRFTEPESGHLVMQQSVSAIDRTTQIQSITWIYDEIGANNVIQRTVAPLTLRYTFPAELDLLLETAGMHR
ncbi:MAG TPA: class I SAM-dependent methyltransferase, partial [Aggregatilineales bacterium]|nr:class I SAM-dependent methyltransferase [Aggregatilineales bacterium]